MSFFNMWGSLKSVPLLYPFLRSFAFLSSTFSHAQPRAVIRCHSFISPLHHLSCPSEYLGIQLSVHLSALFSLTSGNDGEREKKARHLETGGKEDRYGLKKLWKCSEAGMHIKLSTFSAVSMSHTCNAWNSFTQKNDTKDSRKKVLKCKLQVWNRLFSRWTIWN